MRYQFTSGAERVLRYAAGCTSSDDYTELAAPAVLMGLLAESECQAALMLAQHGITSESVNRQWPGLHPMAPNSGISNTQTKTLPPDLERSLQAISQMVEEYVYPPILATEHILLSLLIADDELSQWLKKQGMSYEAVEADVRKRHGYKDGPLPIDSALSASVIEEEFQIENCKRQETGDREQGTGEENQKQEKSSGLQPPASGLPSSAFRLPPSAVESTLSASDLHPSSFILHPSSLAPRPSPLVPLRIIDAAANRAREALRVIEDYVRFLLDDRHLTQQCKQLRHDLTALLEHIPAQQLLTARETQA
ncbi:MAG TPA: Clp protease N-terminal domain-containing protein, partial [Thermoguttaceae bacterium]